MIKHKISSALFLLHVFSLVLVQNNSEIAKGGKCMYLEMVDNVFVVLWRSSCCCTNKARKL